MKFSSRNHYTKVTRHYPGPSLLELQEREEQASPEAILLLLEDNNKRLSDAVSEFQAYVAEFLARKRQQDGEEAFVRVMASLFSPTGHDEP